MRGRCGASVLLVALVLLVAVQRSAAQGEAAGGAKAVHIELRSHWAYTPLTLEASEFLAEQAPELFWRFIDAYKSPISSNEAQEYEEILRITAQFLSPLKMEMLKYALRIRYYSARIEMHRQVAAEEASMRSKELPSAFVVIGDKLAKTVAEFRDLVSKIGSLRDAQQIAPISLPKEHFYPSEHSAADVPTAVLYGQISSADFIAFDAELRKEAAAGSLRYAMRHLPASGEKTVALQGWSAELALKNMEYKAVDDSQAGAQEVRMPGDEEEGILFRTTAAEELRDTLTEDGDILIGQLKASELSSQGLQAAQLVTSSSNPLLALREVSSNYPSMVATLAKGRLQDQVRANATEVQRVLGQDVLVINGRVLRPDTVDPYTLLDIVASETDKFEKVKSLNIGTSDALKILSLSPAKDVEYRFDTRSPQVVWLNDLERDDYYASWPKSMKVALMKGGWPGTPRYAAKNMFSAVVVGSLKSEALEILTVMLSYVRQNLPLRIGVLLHTPENDEVAKQTHKAFLWLAQNSETRVLRSFVNALYSTLHENNQVRELNTDLLLYTLATARGIPTSFNAKAMLGDAALDAAVAETNKAVESKGITVFPATFMNGLLLRGEGRTLYDQILSSAMDYDSLVALILAGTINDDTNLFEYFSTLPETLPRVNPYESLISNSKFFNLFSDCATTAFFSGAYSCAVTDVGGDWAVLTQESRTARVLSKRKYLSPIETEDEVKRSTHLLLLNFSSPVSLKLAHAALTHLTDAVAPLSRVGFLFATSAETETKARTVLAALNVLRLKKALPFLVDFIGDAIGVAPTGAEPWREVLASSAMQGRLSDANACAADEQLFKEDRAFIAQHLSAATSPEQAALLSNGRALVLPAGARFGADDFSLLEKVEWAERTSRLWPVVDLLEFPNVPADDLTSEFRSELLMKLASLMGADQEAQVDKIDNAALPALPISFQYNSESSNDGLSVFAVVDPLGKNAHRVSALLLSLLDHFRVHIKVVLNPRQTYTELPLKTYHRYAIAPASYGVDALGGVVFTHLPAKRLLTLAVDVLESWLIRAKVARYDMDNIKLADIATERVVHAQFELRNILVQGYCHDERGQYGPRGLELALGTRVMPHMEDTIVMSNLGYFQLKANPTAWQLELVGRGSELYDIVKVDGTAFAPTRPIFISGFHGVWLNLDVKKKPGHEQEELLTDHTSSGNGLWSSVKGLFKKEHEHNETIHVFSVATGHLYERFLRIMVLTVLKNTKNPVKFWFLANYLSPRFIDVIPVMAAKYNFQYELVTYKWPAWLNKQTEKQRIIWAYKILFLDVLFPLAVKKIIYVDADQIVRTDLKELTEVDLHGAPYGFTPFCDDKPEMNGFRFWKSGFWKDHLREKPYHISALYVVDLARLRRIGAADSLRATYDSLSRDPNSLANLDQDLPNFLQAQVPIFSLPQEWLWCETWCSEASKEKAKTIDLCNNPLTKIPKLENAHKVIGKYWSELDEEQRKVEMEAVAKHEQSGN